MFLAQASVRSAVLSLPSFVQRVCSRLVLSLPLPPFTPPERRGAAYTNLFVFSLWTASSSMKTNCVADRRNSEFWQRIGQPYACNLGRCFVAVVESEADSLTSRSSRGGHSPTKGNGGKTVRCPTLFWSGRRAGNKQSPDNAASQIQLFRLSFITYLC